MVAVPALAREGTRQARAELAADAPAATPDRSAVRRRLQHAGIVVGVAALDDAVAGDEERMIHRFSAMTGQA